jgi:hypothetical protein
MLLRASAPSLDREPVGLYGQSSILLELKIRDAS